MSAETTGARDEKDRSQKVCEGSGIDATGRQRKCIRGESRRGAHRRSGKQFRLPGRTGKGCCESNYWTCMRFNKARILLRAGRTRFWIPL